MQIKKLFPAAVTIFILPPSWEELKARLEKRGEDTDEVITVVPDAGTLPSTPFQQPAISPDGAKVVFRSNYNLPETMPQNWVNVFL
jgi:hypothetical protein